MRLRIMKTVMLATIVGSVALVGCDGGDDGDKADDTGMMRQAVGGNCANSQADWDIWVPRQGANDIYVLGKDLAEKQVIDLSGTGLVGPHNVTLSDDHSRAFFAMLGTEANAYADGGVVVVNTSDYSIISSIVTNAKTHQVGPTSNTAAWAVNVNNDTFSVIDVASSTVTEVVTVGASGGPLVAKFRDGKAYITNKGVANDKSSVSVFNVATRMKDGADYITGQVTTEETLTSDGKWLYVTNGGDNNVEKIDLCAADRSGAVSVFAENIGGSHAIQLAEFEVVVTARGEGQVQFFEADGKKVGTVDVPATMGNAQPDIIALSPDCSIVYAAEKTGGSLVEIKVADHTIGNKFDFPGGGTPHGVTVKYK